MTEGNDGPRPKPGKFSRRSLIASSAGVATTVAVTTVAPAAAALAHDAPAVPLAHPSTAAPANPLVAWVHNAARGEVTVVHGRVERTYRDPALVKRLLAAANSKSHTEVK